MEQASTEQPFRPSSLELRRSFCLRWLTKIFLNQFVIVCSIFSTPIVPYWKIFIFGGNSGDLNEGVNPQGQYLNDTVVLETGTNTWTRPATLGTIPSERGETQIVYDPKGLDRIFV